MARTSDAQEVVDEMVGDLQETAHTSWKALTLRRDNWQIIVEEAKIHNYVEPSKKKNV